METPLLQTKLYIPSPRPELVPRPRLIERLNAGLRESGGFGQSRGFGRKLTLISAPAGFGKTTLVSEWVQALGETDPPAAIAWLSLDESDNDPTRFLVYVIAALQTIEVGIGQGALSALQGPQPPPAETILTVLINETTAIPDRIVLVLDDYHLIEARPIHDALTFLLRRLPPNMHLIIATREDPPLPLARLRARGQLTEMRAADLRFSSSEVATFFNQVIGLNLSGEDIAALEARTEGWVASLQLAALSMQGSLDAKGFITSFTGSHRYVLDYLIEEVLEQQSESIQRFLLYTSILGRLCGPLCDTVRFDEGKSSSHSERMAGQAILEMLERANLFITPLDEHRHWYRYHHLFSDLLQQRLHQTQPERLPMLHRRASEWHEQNGYAVEAIDHALLGQQYDRAADLIEDRFGANYERADQAALRRWLTVFPKEIVSSRPDLCILHAWILFTSGQSDGADQSLQAAEKMLNSDIAQELVSSPDMDPLSDTDRRKLLGRVTAIRSFLASYGGDMPRAIRYARQALEHLPEQELAWRTATFIALGDAYASQGEMAAAHKARSDALLAGKALGDPHILMMANLRLAEILRQQGKLQQVADICEHQFKRADARGMLSSAIVGWLLGIWGEVLAELDDLDRAIDRAQEGVELAARGGEMLYEVWSNLCLVRVLFSSGDIAGAQDLIRSMENATREYELPLGTNLLLSAWQVRIWLSQEKLEAASQWVRERELALDGEPTYLHEMEYIVFARILIAQGRSDEAARLLQRLLESADAGVRTSNVVEILNLQSLALQAGDDRDQAITTLGKALTLAKPCGFVRVFVDEGPPMARLLYEALSRGISPDYVRRLLAAFPVIEPEQTTPSEVRAATSELIEPLSDRELEILELIAEGLTNPEIASRLFIALNTVKGHARNIYGKLGVHNRTQAVAKGQSLGLLSST